MNTGLAASAIFCCLIFSGAACNSRKAYAAEKDFYSAIDYNDYIVDQQNRIIAGMAKLTDAFESGSDSLIMAAFDSLLVQSDSSLMNIRSLSNFDADSSLRIAASRLFEFYHHIFRNEYPRIIAIFLKGNQANNAEIVRLNQIVDSIREQESIVNQELLNAQAAFAGKFQFAFQKEY